MSVAGLFADYSKTTGTIENRVCEKKGKVTLDRISYFPTDSAHTTNQFMSCERSGGSTALGKKMAQASSTGDDQRGLQLHHAMRRFCPTAEDKFENPA